ncbi:MAG: citrate synthase [Eubacteriales bacterium]|nr:citrate synthase [Eubacteriales bacterium]
MNDHLLGIFRNSMESQKISDEIYKKYDVKKGLRNEDGTGVLVGLTRICDVEGYKRLEDGTKKDIPGELYYRGMPLETVYERVAANVDTGFEEIAFLLLFGYLPAAEDLRVFKEELRDQYQLPRTFLLNNILKASSLNTMNKIQSGLLLMYAEDDNPDDCSVENLLRIGLSIIAKLPAMMVYSHQVKDYHANGSSLLIHPVRHDLDIAESILYLLRGEGKYTQEEVALLDLMMIIHADHGVGNNSTFAGLVVSSTGTDLYSSFSTAVGSLKGPKHGGANITCKHMMDAVMAEVGLDATDAEIYAVVKRIVDKDFFDRSGLVYGIGHAVYTISDPRCVLLKRKAAELAEADGRSEELSFYSRFEEIAVNYLKELKDCNLCANVDFYSGLIYDMLGISEDLYTPMFVASRAIGWLAHIIEESINSGRIIRPAGKYVGEKLK